MTQTFPVAVDHGARLVDVVARTRTLFLGLDGPVCSVFARLPAADVARGLRRTMIEHGTSLPVPPGSEDDPLHLLREASRAGPRALSIATSALQDAEVAAAFSALPTDSADDVLVAALASGRRLAIVSNLSMAAAETYLERVGVRSMFERVVGRYPGMEPERMKPNGHLVLLTMMSMDSAPWHTTLVGTSVADVQAAAAVGILSIGYADEPAKEAVLVEAGADVVITSMRELADALLEIDPPDPGARP